MRIVTYADPFRIKDNTELWDLVTRHPHFCASDTLAQGIIRYYKRDSFTHIRPVQELIDAFLGKYSHNAINDMQMFLTVSDCIRSWPDSPIKQAFLFNKADVVRAVQLLIPLECDPLKFDTKNISEEQRKLLEIYTTVMKSNCYECFSDLDELTIFDYRKAVQNTTINEIAYLCESKENKSFLKQQEIKLPFNTLKSAEFAAKALIKHLEEKTDGFFWANTDASTTAKINQLKCALEACQEQDDEYYSKLIIHGVHKITPIMYYMIKHLEKMGVEVVFLINYANNIPAIYGTWERVYDWCDTSFEFASPIDLTAGRPIGKNMALVLSGKAPQGNMPESFRSFDNMTSFALHEVGNTFSETHGAGLHKMKTQYYAVNGRQCNEILQMYFPEQFSQKPFLSYPIGQFILGLYNMWDFSKQEVHFNYTSLAECAVSGLFQQNSNILEILRKTKLYFSDIESYEDYKSRISLLIEATQKCKHESEYRGWDKISFLSLRDSELNDFSQYIENINSISQKLFTGMSEKLNYTDHFRKLIEVISAPTAEGKILTSLENALLQEIKARLSEEANVSVVGNAQDVKDALAFFLAERADMNTSNWIVRDFEQIDGAVLLSESTFAQKYHFSLLSNAHMLSQGSGELPWPLTEDIFVSYTEVKKALSAVTAAQRERRNFLKYVLFYGSFFSKKAIEFSYVAEEDGEKQTAYYLLEAMGIDPKPYEEKMPATFNVELLTENEGLTTFNAGTEASEMFSVCPYKFLLHEVLKSNVLYYSEFHLKYYLSFYLTHVVRKKTHNKREEYTAALKNEIDIMKKYFPFWGDVIFADIQTSANNALEQYPFTSDKIERRKTNFLIASWTDPETNWKLDFEKPDVSWRLVDYMNESRVYPNKKDVPCRTVCDDCNYESVCLRHYYEAHADMDPEVSEDA